MTKIAVGAANTAFGLANFVGGAAALTGGTATASVHFGLLTGPAAAVGSYRMALGVGGMNRGLQQIAEGFAEPATNAGPRNAMGLLPAGQKFDDVAEPTIVEYAAQISHDLREDPSGTIGRLVGDLLAIGERR